ncbi:12116_t:CDS:2 [Racocetra fulgida]|uniref:12116_t:CDS:1 n=1 Tax=Racocetra fulgida TaxID=60492 RepID=A0A9N9A3N6_9GLOM|nr:12116_t:CDS:2 [Racocetra fulgida]
MNYYISKHIATTSTGSINLAKIREKYGNIRLPSRYQVNNEDEPEMSDLHEKYSQLEVISKEVEYLREENKFLATVNSEFSNKNDILTKENKELINGVSIGSNEDKLLLKCRKLNKKLRKSKRKERILYKDNKKKLSTEDSLELVDEFEMKSILKTVNKPYLQFDYDEKFISKKNIEAALDLYNKNDSQVIKYQKRLLLSMLSDSLYHSPEISEIEDENSNDTIICDYDYLWHSDELKELLQNVLDIHSTKIQMAQLQQDRYYDNKKQIFACPWSENAPEWSYKEQDDSSYNTDIERNLEEQKHDAAILTNEETGEEETPNRETL